jgi:hypothetical protein
MPGIVCLGQTGSCNVYMPVVLHIGNYKVTKVTTKISIGATRKLTIDISVKTWMENKAKVSRKKAERIQMIPTLKRQNVHCTFAEVTHAG